MTKNSKDVLIGFSLIAIFLALYQVAVMFFVTWVSGGFK